MRWAKSYSIVDHQLLHGGYFCRLSWMALALYLFYVVVGDREGKSFYADSTIAGILRLPADSFSRIQAELVREKLISVRSRFVWVLALERPRIPDPLSQRRSGALVSSDRGGGWHTAKESLENLLRSLGHG